jgi:predicted DNA-binding WGR domain protein/tetratricopeptide (TPR) repeat protein
MGERVFVCTEGGSNKFWAVEREGGVLRLRWGKVGTKGQAKERVFADPDRAQTTADTLIAEKTNKGYVEQPSAQTQSSASPPDEAVLAELVALGTASPEELAKVLGGVASSVALSPRGMDVLIALLTQHEAHHGVTQAHRVASEAVRAHLSLVHPFAHDAEITAAALSPSGRWLATGNTFVQSDDGDEGYTRGGVVCIWDLQQGRCGVGSGEEEARGLAWHESETILCASTGTHGIARLDPFGQGTGVVSSIGEGQLHASFDGISPSWCWLPGTTDVVIAKYVVSMAETGATLRSPIGDDRCDFRHRVCAYDGVVTDGQFTIRADTLEPTAARQFRDARVGYAIADLSVKDGVVTFTSPAGKPVTLPVLARVVGIDNGLVTVSVAPDGREVAVLTAGGRVERFSNEGVLLSGVDAPWAHGIALGASRVLVLLAPDRIAFVDLETQTHLGDFPQLREVAPHPLGVDATAREKAFVYDPAFVIGRGWAVVLPTGEVAAPNAVQPLLDGALALSLRHRRAWPLRWAAGTSATRWTTKVSDLADKLPAKIRAGLEKPAKRGKRAGPSFEVVPATVDDVIDFAAALVQAAPPRDAAFEGELLAIGEAAAGRGSCVVSFFEKALVLVDGDRMLVGNTARAAAYAADLLARRGVAEAENVARLARLVLAVPAEEYRGEPTGLAATLGHLARAYEQIGEGARADQLLEQALENAPSWLAEPQRYAPLLGNSDEAALVAKMLLARGDRERAFRIFENLGGGSGVANTLCAAAEQGDGDLLMRLSATYRNVAHDHERAAARLLEAGHIELFDTFSPVVLESPYVSLQTKRELALARHVVVACTVRTKAAAEELLAAAGSLLNGLDKEPTHEVVARLLAVGSAVDACRNASLDDLSRTLAEGLSTAIASLSAEQFAAEAYPSSWNAVAALDRAHIDIGRHLARATTVIGQLMAVTMLLPTAAESRAAVLALALAVEPETVPVKLVSRLSGAAIALSNAGEATLAESFFAAAVQTAGSDYLTLGSIVHSQLQVGHFVAAWETVQRASKGRRGLAVSGYLDDAAFFGHASAALCAARLASPAERQSVVMAARALAKVPFDAS